MLNKLFKTLTQFETVVVAFILLVADLSHAINLFGYPAYQEDEGTYVSQAWSLLTQGKLAPYTYWYDHTPLGWILMSFWNFLSGGFFTFGLSVNSGRVFMLLINLISVYLIYKIVKNLTGFTSAAVVTALAFTLSPLAIIFQRRVFLDNIMVFWFLLSLLFLTQPYKLKNTILSSVTFGLAVLTKETTVILLPIFAVSVYFLAHQTNRSFATISWLFIAVLIISFYPLLAILKGEILPAGTVLGGNTPHVSMIQAFEFQLGRKGGFFLSPDSSFMYSLVNTWLRFDAFYILIGTAFTILNLFFLKNKWVVFLSLMTITYILFLIRGGIVLDWYIIPLLPLFALNIGLFIAQLSLYLEKTFHLKIVSLFLSAPVIFFIFYELYNSSFIFTANQTVNQINAVSWVKKNIDKDSLLLIDNYAYVDLNAGLTNNSDQSFGAQYYWKIDNDPEIRYNVVKNDWRSIDYLLVTPAFVKTMNDENLQLVKQAYDNSTVIKVFEQRDVTGYVYPVEIRQVNNRQVKPLKTSWDLYKQTFIDENGKSIDIATGDTTSEAQSYALLRAVWMGDKETFDKSLSWTMKNLKLKDKNLFSWLHGKTDQGYQIKDPTTASDADEDIALALLFAYKKWGDQYYLDSAKLIINDIWESEVVQIKDKYYLTSGTNSERPDGILINPSYFSPASYRIFAQVDPNHPWNKLADDSYLIIDKFNSTDVFSSKNSHLLPNWFLVKKDNEDYVSAQGFVGDDADKYGYDAFRLTWRITLDAIWFQNSLAKDYLKKIEPFYENEWSNKKSYAAVYNLDGGRYVEFSDLSTTVGPLSDLLVTNQTLAREVYSQTFENQFNKDGFWQDKNNYYRQNWSWFATALYTNNLTNLWGS